MHSMISETVFGIPRQYLHTAFKCKTSNIWNSSQEKQKNANETSEIQK